jgi:hypothetical protein
MCLVLAWKIESFASLSALILSHHIQVGSSLEKPNLIDNVLSHVVSFAPLAKVWYFAFIEDRATIGCHFELHVMGYPPNWNTYLEVDQVVSRSLAQLAFVKLVTSLHIPFMQWMSNATIFCILVFAIARWGVWG